MNSARKELSLEVRCDRAELARVTEALDEFWQSQGLDEDAQADLNIAVEEIVSNVMRHGSAAGDASIELHVALDPEDVTVVVRDSGVPFNPLEHDMPDPNATLEQRRAGGLGIFMVTQMMDRVAYERHDGLNCLTMVRARKR